jgi:hypothetical protein
LRGGGRRRGVTRSMCSGGTSAASDAESLRAAPTTTAETLCTRLRYWSTRLRLETVWHGRLDCTAAAACRCWFMAATAAGGCTKRQPARPPLRKTDVRLGHYRRCLLGIRSCLGAPVALRAQAQTIIERGQRPKGARVAT